jgi:hypothetical protein
MQVVASANDKTRSISVQNSESDTNKVGNTEFSIKSDLKMIKTNMHVHYKSPFIVDTLPQTCGE